MYVYNLSVLEQRIRFLRSSLPAGISLCYAVKANTFILGEISRLVDRLEICSPGELNICRKLGLPTDLFVVSGVYKSPELMQNLVACGSEGIRFTVESTGQFNLLRGLAHREQKQIVLLPRLTSGNQFGLSEEELFQIADLCNQDPFLRICGIQYYSGTQKTSLRRIKRELDGLDAVMIRMRERFVGFSPELEYGPGMPVSYFAEDNYCEDTFLAGFSEMLSGMRSQPVITLELGHSIAASCGTYLTRIVDMKTVRGQKYAVVDGGIHHLVYYGQSMAMKHPVVRSLAD